MLCCGGQRWGPLVRVGTPPMLGLGTAERTLPLPGLWGWGWPWGPRSGSALGHGDPPQLLWGTALGALTVLWLRGGHGPGDSSRTALGIPLCPGVPVGAVPAEVRSWGTLLWTPETHTTAVDVGLKAGSLWTSCLRRGAGGQSYSPPTPKKYPRNTDELWGRSVGSRPPRISFARGGHFWGVLGDSPPVLRV